MHRDPQTILDKSPMTGVQITAVAMCVLLNALDGFDVLSISFASPSIATQWGIDRVALGIVLSMELIGMAVGSITLGGFADKYGRRPVILGCLMVMAAGMLSAGLAEGVIDLSIYRFITGLGIGGMLASTNAMVAEYSNARHRNMAVTFMAGGFPVGIIIGGSISAELLKFYDWRAIFYFGAMVTAIFILFVWFLLPESISYLSRRRPAGALEKINTILLRMKHETIDQLPELKVSRKISIQSLFSGDLRRITLLLTVAYFAHIMTHYFFLKWVPKIVVDMGYAASTAGGVLVWANVGGLISSILMGLLSHRFSIRTLTITVLLSCAAMMVVFGGGADNLQELTLIATVAGFFTQAAVVGMYALFAQSFPTEIRASGTGLVIGLGRGGAALGPITAGLLFSLGYGLQSVAILMASGSIIAFIALVFLKPNTPSSDPSNA